MQGEAASVDAAAASYPNLAKMKLTTLNNRFPMSMKQPYIRRRWHLGFSLLERRSQCLLQSLGQTASLFRD